MTQHVEIEFKNLLTKKQYEHLLTHFQITAPQIHRQINHYFDTPQGHLKDLASGLRIRILPDEAECTLKEKSSTNVHLETTDPLTAEQAAQMLAAGEITAPTVRQRLQALDIPLDTLALFGSLTTDRVELPYLGGTLVFDHSFYLHCDDYEVEYETNDEIFGKKVFNEFLQQFSIKPQVAPKKIARFMNALQQKG